MTRTILYRSVATGLLCCVLTCALTGLPATPDSCWRIVQACLLLVAGLLVDPDKAGRIAGLVQALEAVALFGLIGILGAVASYLVLWHAGPFADAWLDRADHLLGFDWKRIRAAVAAHPWLLSLLEHAYRASFWMPPAILALLCATRRTERAYRMLQALGIAVLCTLPLFFLAPAEAAFAFYGEASPPPNAAQYGTLIAALHGHTLRAIDLNDLGGIITFPSFHATLAILFAWALWPLRALRAGSLALNGMMWFSAIPIGGHYAVDLIGGSLVAWAAIARVRIAGISARPVTPASSAGLAAHPG